MLLLLHLEVLAKMPFWHLVDTSGPGGGNRLVYSALEPARRQGVEGATIRRHLQSAGPTATSLIGGSASVSSVNLNLLYP